MTERSPLRVVMAECFFKELEARSAKVLAQGPEAERLRQDLIQQKLLSEDGQKWLQLQWSTEHEKLMPTTAAALPTQQAHEIIRDTQQLVQVPGLLLRFHALKPLNRVQIKDGTVVVPWKMVIGHREPKASVLFRHMQALCHSGVTQLTLTRIRQANMKRSPMAQKIAQAMD